MSYTAGIVADLLCVMSTMAFVVALIVGWATLRLLRHITRLEARIIRMEKVLKSRPSRNG